VDWSEESTDVGCFKSQKGMTAFCDRLIADQVLVDAQLPEEERYDLSSSMG
jgi:hypothetical protein